MPKYSYDVAKDVLSETDKNRILACYLSMDNPNATTNWAVATTEFKCASQESMKVMVRTALKKIESAGGCSDGADGTVVKAKGGRKRKSPALGEGEDTATTKKKARNPRGKAKPVVKVTLDDEDGDVVDGADNDGLHENIVVKMEDDTVAEENGDGE